MLCTTFDAKDYVLESRPNSSDLVSQQPDLPSYCLGSIRFLFDQSRYLALTLIRHRQRVSQLTIRCHAGEGYLMGQAARSFTPGISAALTRLTDFLPEANISPLELQPRLKGDHAWTAIAAQTNAQQAGRRRCCVGKRSEALCLVKTLRSANAFRINRFPTSRTPG